MPKIETKSDGTGAPAALRRLEEHELKCSQEVDRIKVEITKLRAIAEPDGDEQSRQYRKRIQDAIDDLGIAQDDWIKSLRSLREFDKSVDVTRRDGVKIPQAEVERILTQSWRFQRLGRETFIVQMARDALTVKNEDEFYAKFADSIRECEINSLKAAIEHEKFPKWVEECYEQSL